MHVISSTAGECLVESRLAILSPSDLITRAVDLLKETSATAIVVVDGEGHPLGIFTDRDLLFRVAAAGLTSRETCIADVMTAEPRTLRPQDSVVYAINRMAVGGFTNIPIVDEQNQTIGLLGVRDVVDHLHQIFADLEKPPAEEPILNEWCDIGGGG